MLDRFRQFAVSLLGLGRSQQMRELYLSTIILQFAASAIVIFEPIYLWSAGFSLQRIILFYGAIYAVYFAILPLGGKFVRARGYEHGIMYSTPFLILYYLSLFAIPYSPVFIGTAVVSYALQKMFYWPGYHADFARFGIAQQTGRELSVLVMLASIAAIAGPAVGGLVLVTLGYPALFVLVSLLILLSNVPLLLTPEVFTPRVFSYEDAWKRLWKPENRRKLVSYMGFGEEFIVMIIWPLFMYTVVKEYFNLGAIVSVATLATLLVALAVGRLADTAGRKRVLRLGVVYTMLSWLIRLVSGGLGGVFLADTLYRSARTAIGIPLIASTYDGARRYSVTKTAVFLEASVVAGKLLAAVLCLIIVTFFAPGWELMFLLAAAFTLLYGFYEPERA
ncbi:hypothetical protein EPO33_05130 [Patescibacteria group bacterium]|nr:MAG: hypothetical protein EPO33_05130 [Patescibacteria group bacterium]